MKRPIANLLLTACVGAVGLSLMGGAFAAPKPKPTPSQPAPVSVPAGKFVLEILHTNDLHGHVRPGIGGRGGAGAIASRIDLSRARAKGDPNYDVLVVDAGDIFGGTAEDHFSEGKMMADFLVGAGYDVFTVGNHDFGFGLGPLYDAVARMRAGNVAVLGANIVEKGTSTVASKICSGAILVEKKGLKIGIIGATTPGVERMNLNEFVEGYEFPDPIAIVKEKAEKLTGAGADVIVLVSHVGHDNGKYVDDKKIAAAVPSVRAIIGGHSHTAIKNAYVDSGTGAIVVQTGALGRALGSLALTFDAKTKKPVDEDGDRAIDHVYTLIDLKQVPGQHPIVDELRAKYWDPVKPQLEAFVGINADTLYRKFYKTETQLGDLLADAILDAAPGAQIAMIGNSDLRSDLYKGNLEFKDVFEVVPFDNAVVKLTVSGKVLKEAIDDCYGSGRHFAQVAGMRVHVDSRKPEGERVISIRVNDELVTDGASYVLATSDFIAQGKAGFSQFGKDKYEPVNVTIRDALIARIKKLGTLTDANIPMGRIRDAYLSEEIGRVTTTFSTDMFAAGPNLFDIVASSVLGAPPRGDLALIDSGEIHWRLSERFPVVRRDLNELVPFDRNAVVTTKITGKQLNEVFGAFVKKTAESKEKRFRPYIAGAQIVINGAEFKLLIGGQPVDEGKTYTLVTYDHLLTGPRGFEVLGKMGLKPTSLNLPMRAAVEAWIKHATPVGPEDFPGEPAVIMEGAVSRTATRIANFGAQGEDPAHEPDPTGRTARRRTRKPKAPVDGVAQPEETEEDEHTHEH